MNKTLWYLSGIVLCLQTFALGTTGTILDPNFTLLPSPFPVYILNDSQVINHPYPGATQVLLPTDNSYFESPGCYVACYSHNPGVYSVSATISVVGQIRVKGHYVERICQPAGFKGKDISASETFTQLCADKIPACKNSACWGGGDTGGWFGIQ